MPRTIISAKLNVVCFELHFQRWDWADRCSDHHGNSAGSVGPGSTRVPAGHCQNTERSASHDDSDHGTETEQDFMLSDCSLPY